VAKIDVSKKIQRRRSEDEMRNAVADFMYGKAQRSTPTQDDDTHIILLDVIAELLEARQIMEDVKAFVQSMTAKTARRQ
jgi:regulator of extracellular matrix RemA (YlzA/DUF370 family)